MANNGFSAPEAWFGTIQGLTPVSSIDGATSSLAEAINEYGDTIAHDVYGAVVAPSVDYDVTGTFTSTDASPMVTLGAVTTLNSKSVMLTKMFVKTSANNPPSVTLSGVEVESGATAKRTYAIKLNLTPRTKAQDVAGAFTASPKFTSIDTTYSIDPHMATVKGLPVFSDASHGKVEVTATMTDGDGNGTITAAQAGGFTVTSSPSKNAPDSDYITITATATKFLTGTEPTANGDAA